MLFCLTERDVISKKAKRNAIIAYENPYFQIKSFYPESAKN